MSNQSLPPGASSPSEEPPEGRRERHDLEPSRQSRQSRQSGREDPAPARSPDERGDYRRRDEDGERDERGAPAPPPASAGSPMMALVLHALTFLCCFNWIFGGVGIVFAVRAGHKRDQGRYVEAETLI